MGTGLITHSEIIVKGKVQKAAFRSYTKDIAKKNHLFGFVQNLRNYDEDVLIVCEGNKKDIKSFIDELKELKKDNKAPKKEKDDKIRNLNESEKLLIRIDKIIQRTETKCKPAYTDFFIFRDSEEAGERFDEAAQQLMSLRAETTYQFGDLDRKYGAISESLNDLPKNLADNFSIALGKVLEEHDKRLIKNLRGK